VEPAERSIIQLPADIIMATQEVIWATKPDVIIETGVARDGSVLFMASLLELIGKGTVVGIDIGIRAHNRDSIERPSDVEAGRVDRRSVHRTQSDCASAEGYPEVRVSDGNGTTSFASTNVDRPLGL
jgi:cephalosporin hydroxylase